MINTIYLQATPAGSVRECNFMKKLNCCIYSFFSIINFFMAPFLHFSHHVLKDTIPKTLQEKMFFIYIIKPSNIVFFKLAIMPCLNNVFFLSLDVQCFCNIVSSARWQQCNGPVVIYQLLFQQFSDHFSYRAIAPGYCQEI